MKQISTRVILLLSCTILASSCDSFSSKYRESDPIDRDAGLQREDFKTMRDAASLQKPEVTANVGNVIEPPIPDLAEILTAPPKPKIGETQLVSLAVTDDVPLKDVLLEVARLAKVDIDVDASISGGVSLRATDKPFNEVIERISEMAGLRYSMKNGVLKIERDTPYIKLYSLDLLNSERSSSGSISIGGAGGSSPAASGGAGGAGGSSPAASGGAAGSSSNITAKADSDFWKKFEESIKQILEYAPSQQISARTLSAQPVPPASTAAGIIPPISPQSSAASMKPMQADMFVGDPSGMALAGAASASTPTKPIGEAGNRAFFVVNRQASTLTVSGTEKQHEMIKKFLDKIVANTSSQVLIEAKVIEVNLSDAYQSGINWTKFGGGGVNISGDLSQGVISTLNNGVPVMTLINKDVLKSGVDLSAAVKMLNEFGTTRAISSPRLNAMNNQQAVLSFVEQLQFFDVKLETTDATFDTTTGRQLTAAKVTTTSTLKTAPVGIVLNLQPSINTESQEVTIGIRPTITRLVKLVSDPGFEIGKANAIAAVGAGSAAGIALSNTHSDYPQIETKEIDSIVKIKSGQTLVIGGLLEDKVINTDAGVPYASEVPFFGNLFKAVDKKNTKKELVIFIRATIIGSNGSADPYDKAVYEKFIQDPRPLKF